MLNASVCIKEGDRILNGSHKDLILTSSSGQNFSWITSFLFNQVRTLLLLWIGVIWITNNPHANMAIVVEKEQNQHHQGSPKPGWKSIWHTIHKGGQEHQTRAQVFHKILLFFIGSIQINIQASKPLKNCTCT